MMEKNSPISEILKNENRFRVKLLRLALGKGSAAELSTVSEEWKYML